MITYKQVDQTYLPQYDQIPMIVQVNAYYRIEKANRGLGGFPLSKHQSNLMSKTSVPMMTQVWRDCLTNGI